MILASTIQFTICKYDELVCYLMSFERFFSVRKTSHVIQFERYLRRRKKFWYNNMWCFVPYSENIEKSLMSLGKYSNSSIGICLYRERTMEARSYSIVVYKIVDGGINVAWHVLFRNLRWLFELFMYVMYAMWTVTVKCWRQVVMCYRVLVLWFPNFICNFSKWARKKVREPQSKKMIRNLDRYEWGVSIWPCGGGHHIPYPFVTC